MKKADKLRFCAFFLAVIMLIFAIPMGVSAEDEIPTIYLDNSIWYRCKLCPLITLDGVICVPTSVFDGYDQINISYSKEYDTYVFKRDDTFLSVKTDGSSFSSLGERKIVTFFEDDGQLYISAEAVANVFELITESGNYYGTDVIRISKEEPTLSLKNLVDSSKSTGSIKGDTFEISESPNHKGIASIVTDLTGTDFDTAFSVTAAIEEAGVPVTVLINGELLQNTAAQTVIVRLMSAGCSFAIKAQTIAEADLCSKYMYDVFGNTTQLVAGSREIFSGTNYTMLDIAGADDAFDFDFGRDTKGKPILLRLNIGIPNMAYTLSRIASDAAENYILITQINSITGQ